MTLGTLALGSYHYGITSSGTWMVKPMMLIFLINRLGALIVIMIQLWLILDHVTTSTQCMTNMTTIAAKQNCKNIPATQETDSDSNNYYLRITSGWMKTYRFFQCNYSFLWKG